MILEEKKCPVQNISVISQALLRIMESIVLVFEFCEEKSHRPCVVVQFIQKPSFSYIY